MITRDVIILAAGRGDRLKGIAAPFHKPLMVVDGLPLVVRAVNTALEWRQHGRVVVVAAPDNVVPISHLLRDLVDARLVTIVVQVTPSGPGAALLTGMTCTRSSSVVVLLGDNVIPAGELDVHTSTFSMGYTTKLGGDAVRYTRVVDGVVAEGPCLPYLDVATKYAVWVGPLVLPSEWTKIVLEALERTPGELKIGAHLQAIKRASGLSLDLVPSGARDVGVPEELL